MVSKLETQQGTAATHQLESRGQALSAAGLKCSKRRGSHSRPGESRAGVVSRFEKRHGMAATHKLESRGQVLSASLKHSETWQLLTSWRAKNKRSQQA